MKIAIFGAAGFIGTNLAIDLSKDNDLTLVDTNLEFFSQTKKLGLNNVSYKEMDFFGEDHGAFDDITKGQDLVFHLVSSNAPTTSNQKVYDEIIDNVSFSIRLLDSCVRNNVKRVAFISSGGTVYGKEIECPLKEELPTKPISSYGVQKVTIEKILYLYSYINGIEYKIIRLANPYGPFQRPNGVLGAVTTFTYKALKNENITVYGDGTVVRDYIYIADAVNAIRKIVLTDSKYNTYNLGSGIGHSINQVLDTIKETLNTDLNIEYKEARKVDVPVNYLDISRYEEQFGVLDPTPLSKGILLTADFMKNNII